MIRYRGLHACDRSHPAPNKRNPLHKLTPKSILILAIIAVSLSARPSTCADALFLSRRYLHLKNPRSTNSSGLQRCRTICPQDGERAIPSEKCANPSPLYYAPATRRLTTQHDQQFFRRVGYSRLNYKDTDDELPTIIESKRPIYSRFFGGFKRKSLTKVLFPPLDQEDQESTNSLDELMSIDRMDLIQDIVGIDLEEEVSRSSTLVKPIAVDVAKIKRKNKKKDQVIVSNIHELHEAILDMGLELRDIELNYSPPPSLLTSKKEDQPSATKKNSTLSPDAVQLLLIANEIDQAYSMADWDVECEHNDEPNADEWQLIGNVIAEHSPFPTCDASHVASGEPKTKFSHDVLNLLHQRYHSRSTPKSRAANDTAILSLAIEGGGMRGAVSGGMAAAIVCLGLSDAFDSIYGSSAGSIIGSYFVSRQLYLDVYTDIIPAGKDLFVSKPKIIGDIFRNMFYVMKGPLGKRLTPSLIERFRNPTVGSSTMNTFESLPPTRAGGLNISFVLDSIMCPERGLRPLDLESFAHNDAVQPLRIVSSAVELETGMLKSICFGSKDGHFKDNFANPSLRNPPDSTYLYPEVESARVDENGNRRGLWACLGASMTVPGAAGSPFRMDLPSSDTNELTPHLCFDAFCYEPIPFRSAVAEGATHVVALRSRPAGFEPKTKPTLYERAVAPLYFRSNGVETVAEFFQRGGQQYLYAEDVLICDQGLNSIEPIPIPPAKVLYAAPEKLSADGFSSEKLSTDKDRKKWARAHLLPITVPADVPELSTLSQDRDDILAGIRAGFAAAYDALAPVVGLESGLGMMVAQLVFPDVDAPQESVLEKQFSLTGEKLGKPGQSITPTCTNVKRSVDSADLSSVRHRNPMFRRLLSVKRVFGFRKLPNGHANVEASKPSGPIRNDSSPPVDDADVLFSFLPGVRLGSLPLVAERLQTYLESIRCLEDVL
ncbi:hypothetical protein ACHAXA_008668 [Cyclostephanos tholiformis]|uniref:PNPLA domain-containing protein n=1 Tax=Cyclostephanos tholiformis TaxID=382380 RepID=A0ABD3R530_9STRA